MTTLWNYCRSFQMLTLNFGSFCKPLKDSAQTGTSPRTTLWSRVSELTQVRGERAVVFMYPCIGWGLVPGKGRHQYSLTLCVLLLLSRFSCVQLCATPSTAAHQASPSLGFSRQEYWSGVPLPSPHFVCRRSKSSWTKRCRGVGSWKGRAHYTKGLWVGQPQHSGFLWQERTIKQLDQALLQGIEKLVPEPLVAPLRHSDIIE